MLSIPAILWLTFAILGESCLLIALLTLAFIKSLPQRTNPLFINFLLTTFLAQIAPLLLFITVGPMFGIALVVLIFQTWVELRALTSNITPITIKYPFIRTLMLLAPYVTMVSWCIASLAVAMQVPANLGLTQIVYCANNSMLGARVRRFVGFFMLVFGIIEFVIEASIGRLIYINLLGGTRRTWGKYVVNYHFAVRVCILCFLQLVPIVLATLNSLFRLNSPQLWNGTHILESMNALVTFLVFGTSTELLQLWGLKKRQTFKASSVTERSGEANEHTLVINVA